MARGKKHTAEQIVNLLRQVEVSEANGKTVPQACKEAGIVEQTYYRWRKEYGGLKVDQAKRLKELERENGKLKRLVSVPRSLGLHAYGECRQLRRRHADPKWSRAYQMGGQEQKAVIHNRRRKEKR